MTMETVHIRASSLSELLDCPARWKAKHLDGIRMPYSGPAWLGTALHRSTAAFDQARLDGDPVTADDTAGVLVDALHHPDEDVVWDEITPRQAEPIALTLHTRYCADVAPEHDYVGVEITCDALDVEVPEQNITIRLTGTTDRIRRLPDGRFGIADLKSGKRAVGTDGRAVTKGHGPQLGVYELLAEQAIGQPMQAPAEIIGLQTTGNARVGTGEISNARAALVGVDGTPGMLEHAAMILRHGMFHGNPRSSLCSPKYCPAWGGCPFHE